MYIQTLREQGLEAKAIRANYPDKKWSLSTLQTTCRRIDETGSAASTCRAEVSVAAAGGHFEHCFNTEWAADIRH